MRPGRPSCVGLVGLSLLSLHCATGSNTEEELSRMRREMASMKSELSETKLEVQRLEGRVTLLALGQDRVQPSPTTAPVQTTRPAISKRSSNNDRVLPVVRLGNKAPTPKVGEEDAWVDPGAADDGGPAISLKLSHQDSEGHDRLSVDKDVLKKPDPVLSANGDDKAAYEEALKLLREDHQPDVALEKLVAHQRTFATSKLADNVGYWIGECHFQLKAYEASIKALSAMRADHPRSDKVADAMTREGEAWLMLSNAKKGRALLDQVVREHPGTAAAERASTLLGAQGGN
jgi:TolA-binding protein